MNENAGSEDRVSLCASCIHVRFVRSDRGAEFYQCQRASTDRSFPRYPQLPVLDCRGHECRQDSAAQAPPESF
jgi:hypothetical protein